jgi:hypothetical protein
MIRDSPVIIVTNHGLDDRVSIYGRERNFILTETSTPTFLYRSTLSSGTLRSFVGIEESPFQG